MNDTFEIAERRHGLMTRAQLAALGMSGAQIQRRVSNGVLERTLPNVFRVVGSVPTTEQRELAACLWVGPSALLSHASAGMLMRLEGIATNEIHVTVPADERRRGHGIVVHGSAVARHDVRIVDSIPCTSAARTLLDCAVSLDDEMLEAAFESARRMGLVTPATLQRALARRPGAAALRRVLAAAEHRAVESRLEVKLARALPNVFTLSDRFRPLRRASSPHVCESDRRVPKRGRSQARVSEPLRRKRRGGCPPEPTLEPGGEGGRPPLRHRDVGSHPLCARYDCGVTDLSYAAFDADNHYYEALDAFTRHVDPRMQPRCVQWCEINGRKYHVVGGIVSHAVVNPTFDPVAKAGAMHDYFRGNPNKLQPYEFLREREPIPAEYRDRDARVAKLHEFGLEAVWLFPTLGILYEELIKHDIEAVTTLFSAFNRWLDDDWGLDYQGRIFSSPYITLADLDWAIRELEWALDHGARHVVMRPAAPTTASGQIPVSDPRNDAFWARVNEAGITVVVHAGDSGYSSNGYAADGFAAGFSGNGRWAPSVKAFHIERAAYDFLITLVFDKLFERFPNVRVASVENGAEFLGDLFNKLRSTEHKMPGYFTEDPVESFKRNVWINPFWEDDVNTVVGYMGADRVIFGSDWPHIEGMPRPLDYAVEVKQFDDAAQLRIMRDNARELTTLKPA